MFRPFPLYIGLRYTRAKRRNHFISFISLTSMLGIALGVTALITVLSVMNGFEKELRERMLGMSPHIVIGSYAQPVENWQQLIKQLKQRPEITGIAPYIEIQAMLSHSKYVYGALVQGLLPEYESFISEVQGKLLSGKLTDLQPGSFKILIGSELAAALGVSIGDQVTLIVPQASVTPVGLLPRMKRMTVAGIFRVGMHDFDSGLALVNLEDAATLLRLPAGQVHGLNLKVQDMFRAPLIARGLLSQLPEGYFAYDWTYRHANFFKAIKMEKTVMFIILTLIVAVAAFNIVSTLVMVVTDKQADIAILRTLGATPRTVMVIFMVQGTFIGIIGTLLGVFGGVSLALNVETLVPLIEGFFNTKFLPPEVYYISEVPSDLHLDDVLKIGGVSLLISLLATLYPAWRAARVHPAEALRYE